MFRDAMASACPPRRRAPPKEAERPDAEEGLRSETEKGDHRARTRNAAAPASPRGRTAETGPALVNLP